MSDQITREQLHTAMLVVNALSGIRRELISGGATAYGGKRQYNVVLGYPDKIELDHYLTRYHRQDIAGRIVDLPAMDTWKLEPIITDGEEEGTAFTDAVEWLVDRRRLWAKVARADRISGIGRYGGLYLGFKDGQEPNQEVKRVTGPEAVLFLRPFSEAQAKIEAFETDTQSERFGLPSMYKLKVDGGTEISVHWTRILHMADNCVDSDWEGIPRLQRVYNRLDDLVKGIGGAAEASWLNMRPGTVITTQPGYDMNLDDDETKAAIDDEIQEYVHGIMRFLTLEGVDVKQLQGQIMDPEPLFKVEIALISAASGIPQRVLLGSAAGELAAAEEDTKQWYGTIQARQTNYAEPDILRPLLDRFIILGAIPEPTSEGYEVEWQPLFEASDAELAATAESWARAINTMGAEVSNKEKREKLGMPVEIPEDMMDPEPEEPEPEEDEDVNETIPTEEELDGMPVEAMVIQTAQRNLEQGLITNEAYLTLLEGLLEDAQSYGE